MSFQKFAAALLMALLPAAAQPPLPTLRIEPAAGGSVFYIKNTASQPVTAYLIELVDYPGSSYWLCQDDALAEPIQAGSERRTPISNMTVGAVPDYVKMQAALFADGSSAGIPERIALLIEGRRTTFETARELIRRVEKAQSAAASKDSLIAELEQYSASLSPPGGSRVKMPEAIRRGPAKALIGTTASGLKSSSVEQVLTTLRAKERTLAASKPPL